MKEVNRTASGSLHGNIYAKKGADHDVVGTLFVSTLYSKMRYCSGSIDLQGKVY
ncbi:MAG: hypothetical protein ACLSCD_01040 [Subdoligranulum sp.]